MSSSKIKGLKMSHEKMSISLDFFILQQWAARLV